MICHLIELCGDDYEVDRYERKTALICEEQPFHFPDDIQPGDALIAFSKKSVLDVAGRLEETGINASVIYGSLPPENSVRKGALLHLLTDLLRQFFYSNIKIKKTANVLRHFSSVQLLMHKILIRSLLSQELFSMTTLLPFT